jgi:hypothetical protein
LLQIGFAVVDGQTDRALDGLILQAEQQRNLGSPLPVISAAGIATIAD